MKPTSDSSNTKLERVMTTEQFNQMTTEEFNEIVTAIVVGKYSWACVLILRVAGYNPLHYLPYRTYKRLVKDNSPRRQKSHEIQKSYRERNQTLSAAN